MIRTTGPGNLNRVVHTRGALPLCEALGSRRKGTLCHSYLALGPWGPLTELPLFPLPPLLGDRNFPLSCSVVHPHHPRAENSPWNTAGTQ